MKIYSIKPDFMQKPLLTASRDVAVYCVNFYHDAGVTVTIDEYEVKTQGKNFNDIAYPKKLSRPPKINLNKL